jgi:glycosyltransferase involved in cell wall biosynthesis
MRYGIDGRYIQDHFPGIGRYTYNLVPNLAALAPDDDLYVFHDPQARNTRYDLSVWARLPNVTLVSASAGTFTLKQQWLLPSLARHYRLALYHNPYYVIPYAMPCPTIAMLHDLIPRLYPQSLPNPRLARLFVAITRLTLWRARCVLVDAESTRQDLLRVMHARPERVVALPLAVDGDFRPRTEDETGPLRQRLGLVQPYVLYVGINKPHKNLVRLVEAWGGLPADLRAGHTLVLAGWEDPRYPETRNAVQQRRLEDQVRFLGAVSHQDLPLLYAGALGFVFPSLYEGFGLPVLEAMASGTPVACAHTSSLPEIVGEAALTFDPHSLPEMREALARLLLEPDLRRRLTIAGCARAHEFTWARTAAATLEIYRQIV